MGDSTSNNVVLTATDSNGATAKQEFTIVVTNVNDAPVFDPSESTAIAFEDNEFSYDVPAASDVDSGDTLTYTKQSGPNWVSFDATTGKLTGTPKNSDVSTTDNTTDNTVVIRATDLSGRQDDFTLEIEVRNTPDKPVFNPSTGTTTAVEDSEFSYMVKATDDDSDFGDTLTYTKQSGPNWVSVNTTTGELTGTPLNANVGSDNTVVIRATDESLTYAEFTLTINVTNTNDIPTFTSTAVTTGKTGLLYTYAIETSDDDGDSVTVSTRTVPTWLSLTGNVLSGTPGINDKGDHDVVLRAADSYGTYATQSFTISVSQFKPADKDELQTAIDKWYDLANFSTTTTSTSETNTSDTTGEVSEKTKFYINDINSTPIEIDIDGKLSTDSFNGKQGITRENLVKVEIGTKVDQIFGGAFSYCSTLKIAIIPDSVTSIGDEAFRNCEALKNAIIPDRVTTISPYVFLQCSALESVTIGNNVTTITYRAFFRCNALQSVTIPDSVTNIGNSAFQFCSALQSVTIGNSVTNIRTQAFQGCSALTTVSIPDSVTSIGSNAFKGTGITTINVTSNNGLGLTEGLQSGAIGGKSGITVVFIVAAEEEEKSKLISNTPIIRTLNNSITFAKYGSPMKDLTSDNTMFFAMNRYRYIRTKDTTSNVDKNEIKQQKKWYGNNDNSRLALESNYQRRLDFPNNEFNIQGNAMSNTSNYQKKNGIFYDNYVQRSITRTRAGGARVPLKVTQKNIS